MFQFPLKYPQKLRNFHGVHTLVIDEISMISSEMFTIINRRMSEITNNDQPFGNLNVIVIRDLFQLRPVVVNKSLKIISYGIYLNPHFFYKMSDRPLTKYFLDYSLEQELAVSFLKTMTY